MMQLTKKSCRNIVCKQITYILKELCLNVRFSSHMRIFDGIFKECLLFERLLKLHRIVSVTNITVLTCVSDNVGCCFARVFAHTLQ